MPVPHLIHPVDIVLEQINKAETDFDEDAREPIQHAASNDPITIKGQPRFYSQKELSAMIEGAEEGARGYVLFRKVDLDAAGIALQVNDSIRKIGHVETDVYVVRLEWCGHYAETNGASMVKAHFADRMPARQERG